jgi:hypothetical protein
MKCRIDARPSRCKFRVVRILLRLPPACAGLDLEFRAIGLTRPRSDKQILQPEGIVMERRMSSMTQMENARIIGERKPVILPTGATEAHGPHMPTDADTHQAEYIALRLAERIDAVVALETAFQLATRRELVKMAELAGAKYGPVGWESGGAEQSDSDLYAATAARGRPCRDLRRLRCAASVKTGARRPGNRQLHRYAVAPVVAHQALSV